MRQAEKTDEKIIRTETCTEEGYRYTYDLLAREKAERRQVINFPFIPSALRWCRPRERRRAPNFPTCSPIPDARFSSSTVSERTSRHRSISPTSSRTNFILDFPFAFEKPHISRGFCRSVKTPCPTKSCRARCLYYVHLLRQKSHFFFKSNLSNHQDKMRCTD